MKRLMVVLALLGVVVPGAVVRAANSAPAPSFADGHGLKNCSTRLAKIGGSFRIESVPGRGTTFHVHIPLRFLTVFQTEEQETVAR